MPFWLQDIVFGLLAGIAVITGQVRGLRYPASSREGHSAGLVAYHASEGQNDARSLGGQNQGSASREGGSRTLGTLG